MKSKRNAELEIELPYADTSIELDQSLGPFALLADDLARTDQ